MVNKIEKVIYAAHAKSTGGREGTSRTSDGLLDLKLAVPKEMGGAGGGVNPEQLFASGYSACFIGAMKFVAARDKLPLPADTDAEQVRTLILGAFQANDDVLAALAPLIARSDGTREMHPRRDTALSAGDTAYLVGPYRELLATLRQGSPRSD